MLTVQGSAPSQRAVAMAEVGFDQMAEFANRCLIGRRLTAQVNIHEATHRRAVIQRILHDGVRQVELDL